jgi:hypothetical protein
VPGRGVNKVPLYLSVDSVQKGKPATSGHCKRIEIIATRLVPYLPDPSQPKVSILPFSSLHVLRTTTAPLHPAARAIYWNGDSDSIHTRF